MFLCPLILCSCSRSVDAKLKFHVPEIVLFNQDICTNLQLVELKEAEKQSLKESERLEKEVAEVQELKVTQSCCLISFYLQINTSIYFSGPRYAFSFVSLF